MVEVDDIRRIALALPRTTEAVVRDRVKFRVGRIVYLALSRDETMLGFGCRREEREGMVAAEPHKFVMPTGVDLKYHWLEARLAALDRTELAELITDAWTLCVPKSVAAAHLRQAGLS